MMTNVQSGPTRTNRTTHKRHYYVALSTITILTTLSSSSSSNGCFVAAFTQPIPTPSWRRQFKRYYDAPRVQILNIHTAVLLARYCLPQPQRLPPLQLQRQLQLQPSSSYLSRKHYSVTTTAFRVRELQSGHESGERDLRHHRRGRNHSSCTVHGRQPFVKDDDENSERPERLDLFLLMEQVVGTIMARPTPAINPPLPLVYPITLAVMVLVLPGATAVLLVAFFVLYSYIGRQWILNDYFDEKLQQEEDQANKTKEDDNDEEDPAPNTDLLALGGAIVSAGILAPSSMSYGATVSAVSAAASGASYDNNLWVAVAAIAGSIGIWCWSGSSIWNNNKMDFTKEEEESSSLPPPTTIMSPEQELMSLWDQNLTRNTDRSIDDQ